MRYRNEKTTQSAGEPNQIDALKDRVFILEQKVTEQEAELLTLYRRIHSLTPGGVEVPHFDTDD